MNVLVTGASGQLGRALLAQLKSFNYKVRATSRTQPKNIGHFEWVYSDLLSGDGLDDALKEIDVIIHAAKSPLKNSKMTDVYGFERFVNMLGHVKHFIYPSIVGIEEIPFKYYKHKLEAEQILTRSTIPYTLVRATQFHSFVDTLLLSRPILHTYIIPGSMKFQSVDTDDVARHLIQLIAEGAQGRTEDFCGPEIMKLKDMAELKIRVRSEPNKVVSLSSPGRLHKAFAEGRNTNADQSIGTKTYEEYLMESIL